MAPLNLTRTLLTAVRGLLFVAAAASGLPQGNPPNLPVWEPGRPMPQGGPVYLSGDRHQIIVSLEEEGGKAPRIVRLSLWNNILPTLRESLERSGGGMFHYTFKVGNDAAATDSIGTWALLIAPTPIPFLSPFGPKPPGEVWHGAPSGTVVTVDQAALGRTEKGRYLRWFPAMDSYVIAPGKTVDGFGVDSSFLPGFTTAWFGSGKLVEFDQSWPEAVFKQLEKLEDKRWREVYLAVIGPMFAADDPPEVIAQNYLAGINAWIEAGRLRRTSPFVSGSITALNRLLSSQTEDRRIGAEPVTEDERLVSRAMQLSLGMRSGKE